MHEVIVKQEERAALLGHPSYVWRFGQDRRLALVRSYVALEGRRILDIGCGVGTYVRKFREFSQHVWGIDVELDRVQAGSRDVPNLAAARGEDIPYGDATFDVVFLHEVLEHVEDDARVVREAYRVLKPGGHMVIFVPNRLYLFETHGFYLGKKFIFRLLPLGELVSRSHPPPARSPRPGVSLRRSATALARVEGNSGRAFLRLSGLRQRRSALASTGAIAPECVLFRRAYAAAHLWTFALSGYAESGRITKAMASRHRYQRRRRQRSPGGSAVRGILASAAGLLLAVSVLGAIVAGGAVFAAYTAYAYVAEDLAPPETIATREVSRTAKIFDRKGRLLYEIFDPQLGRRTTVSLREISPYLVQATIATEDADFYENQGINIRGMLRALWNNITSREVVQGEAQSPSSW